MHKIQGRAIALWSAGLCSITVGASISSVQAQCFMQTESGQTIPLDFCDQSPSPLIPEEPTTNEIPSQPLSAQHESSSRSVLESVTKEQWEEIYHRHYHRDTNRASKHSNPLSLDEVRGIMGFWGEQVWSRGHSEKWRWTDAENSRKQSEIIFINREMHQGSAIGL